MRYFKLTEFLLYVHSSCVVVSATTPSLCKEPLVRSGSVLPVAEVGLTGMHCMLNESGAWCEHQR